MELKVHPTEKSPHIFKNKYLEMLTKTSLWVIDTLYGVISIVLIYAFLTSFEGTVSDLFTYFILGFLFWTLTEYLMHRFVYHDHKDSSFEGGYKYVFHGIHHEFPNDEDRIILPPVPSIVLASLFFAAFYFLFDINGLPFFCGFIVGYSTYISIHWLIHKKPIPKRFNFWWKHHNIHHYQQHDRAFGVSTKLWDVVFRTMPEKNRRTTNIKVVKD